MNCPYLNFEKLRLYDPPVSADLLAIIFNLQRVRGNTERREVFL
jgi:hypothetical protein